MYHLPLNNTRDAMKYFTRTLAAGFALFISTGVNAAVVKYAYQAKVTSIVEHNHENDEFSRVTYSEFAGASMAVGDTLNGFFQYDTSVGLSKYQPTQQPGVVNVSYNSGATDFISFTDQASSLAFESMTSTNWLETTFITNSEPVANGLAFDSFFMHRSAMDDQRYDTIRLSLYDSSGNAFSDATIPAKLHLSSFQYAQLGGVFSRIGDSKYISFLADLTSLEQVEVPEPSSVLLFVAAGLAYSGVKRTAAKRR